MITGKRARKGRIQRNAWHYRNLGTYPMPVANAIFLNSFMSGFVQARMSMTESLANFVSGWINCSLTGLLMACSVISGGD